ncbi:ABC transporter ATP-binding protein [Lewinella sp. LCG006]|uniref:ABC transporter ATP-binding protein n=1 Tax=Lewinella sp. LCG006 TaxID=3231911 RepID=UPI0034613C8C
MTNVKKILKNHFSSLAYFYSHLRYRLLLLLVVSIVVGLLDGLGLAMFLPLLELVADQETQASSAAMGNLAFILDGIQNFGLKLTLTVVLLTMLAFFIFKGIANYLSSYLNVIYLQFFIRKIRVDTIDALTEYRYQAFVNADAGAIQNTLSGEVERVAQAYKTYSRMLQQGVLVLTYAGIAFLANPEFALLVLVGGVLSNFLFSILYKKTKVLSQRLVKSSHSFQGLLIQEVAFFKYLKSTGSIRSYAENLKEKVYEIEDSVRKMGVLNSIMAGVREPLMMTIVVCTILVQVHLMGGSLATIILSLLFFYRALSSVTQLQTSYNAFLSFSGSLTNMTDFVAELRAQQEPNGQTKVPSFAEAITLENVSFGYQPGDWILQDIELSLHRYETLALVGESGSGKTTLMNLLSGLLQPSKGCMYIDGLDSSEVDIRSLQQRIGYITQEVVIFDDTIFNNVTFWAEKTPENLERFREALRRASILDFVLEQSAAENAGLGNNGINLSGGQKQRISIARELYKDVDFLFMDEATSALDSETERAIQENIDLLKGQYTMLIIAHRLSTIKNADRVIVLKQGRIEHVGRYEELIEKSVSFKRMVELQEL